MRYDVPFVSQYEDLADPQWQWRGCGIVALKMVLDYWNVRDSRNRTASLDELHRAGLAAGAYRQGIGWIHAGLATLAGGMGYESYNHDWAPNGPTPKTPHQAFQALLQELERGPVLASVYSGFEPSRGGGHIVVITGFQDDLVFVNDPEQRGARDGRRLLARQSFLDAFKRRTIVVRPPDAEPKLNGS